MLCICEVVCVGGGLSELHREGRMFGGLGLQDQPDVSSVRNIVKVHSLKRGREQERLSL